MDPAPRAAGSEAHHHQGGSFSTQVPSSNLPCLPLLLPGNSSLLSAPTLLSLSLEQLEDCSEPGPALSLSERKVAAPLARRLSSSAAQPSIPCGAVGPTTIRSAVFPLVLLKTPSGDSERLPKPASGNTSEPVEFCFQNK